MRPDSTICRGPFLIQRFLSSLLAAANRPRVPEDEVEVLHPLELVLSRCPSVEPNREFLTKGSGIPKPVTLVHLVSKHGNVRLLERLSTMRNVDFDARTSAGESALFSACAHAPPSTLKQTVEWLIEHGARIGEVRAEMDPITAVLDRLDDDTAVEVMTLLSSSYKAEARSFAHLSPFLLRPKTLSIKAYRFLLSLDVDLLYRDPDAPDTTTLTAAVNTLHPAFVAAILSSISSSGASIRPKLLTASLWAALKEVVDMKQPAAKQDSDNLRSLNERVSEISRLLLQHGAPMESFPFSMHSTDIRNVIGVPK